MGSAYFTGGNVGIGTTAPTSLLSVQGNTDLGNSYGNTTSSTYTTRISGYAMRYDASNRYGNYGVLILNADSGWTSSARRFMLTNGLNVNKFAIIRSVDSTTDPSFGDGGAISSGTADFVIDSAGNVGIGTTSPTSKLQVSGNIDATGVISQTFWTNDSIRKLNSGASLNFRTAAGPIEMVLDGFGNVGIGTTEPSTKLHVDGVIKCTDGTSTDWNTAYLWGDHGTYNYWNTASPDPQIIAAGSVTFQYDVEVQGTFSETSARRYKENIVDLEPVTDKVYALRPVRYNKIGTETQEIGLIAEEVAELFPEVVHYNDEGQPESLNYTRLSVLLLQTVKELSERIQKLENK